MLTLNKKQALKMRESLLCISVVKLPKSGYGFEVLCDTGHVYALKRMESPERLTYSTVDGAVGTVNFLKFESFSVRL